MPRNAKPIQLHIAQGNPNRKTKAQIKHRIENEIKLGEKVFDEPDILKGDTVAREKWTEIVQTYINAGVDFVSSSDIGVIARYCLTYSQYAELVKRKDSLRREYSKKRMNSTDISEAMNKTKILPQMISLSDLLIKLESQLFLTPLSKVKNIPKMGNKKEEVDPLKEKGFGHV